MSKATAILRYPGGKSRKSVQQTVLYYAPSDYEEYREVLCGGAGVFFGIDRSVKRWINDKNADVATFYRAVRDRSQRFIADCRAIPPAQDGEEQIVTSEGVLLNKRLHDLFYWLLDDLTVDPALRYFYHNRTSFAGRVMYDRSLVSRLSYSNPKGWNIVATDKLERAAEHLQGVTITCCDFERVMMKAGKGVWIYADPPYVADTEASRSAKLYQHSFTYADHERLARAVRNCGHKVCLSYDDHPLIRRLYKGMNIHEHAWMYTGSPRQEKKLGRELIITNYATGAIGLNVFCEGPIADAA